MEKLSKILAILLIIVVAAFAYTLIFGLSFEFPVNEGKDAYLPLVSGENISTYKASCTELNLSKTSENLNSLNGQKVKVKGQIQKKMENVEFNKTRTYIELKVPKFKTNPILVSYLTTIPYIEGDTIEVYGEYTYSARTETSVEMANKDLIMIKAAYIEKT